MRQIASVYDEVFVGFERSVHRKELVILRLRHENDTLKHDDQRLEIVNCYAETLLVH